MFARIPASFSAQFSTTEFSQLKSGRELGIIQKGSKAVITEFCNYKIRKIVN
jgi:hypothetical protein